MSPTVRFIAAETLLGVGWTMWLSTGGAYRRISMAQQIAALQTGLHVVFTDPLTARVTRDDVGSTVWFVVDSTCGLIGLAKNLATSSTVSAVGLADLFAAPTAHIQMLGSKQIFAVGTFRCMVQATDFVAIGSGNGVLWTKRIAADGTGSGMLGTDTLTGMCTRLFVVVTNDAITVITVSNEVDTIVLLALSTCLGVRIAKYRVMLCTL